MTNALEVRSLTASYGKINAIAPITLTIPRGGIVSVVGPNGAGKSTLLCAIAGLLKASGDVFLDGERISGLSTEKRIARGLCLVPEKRELFSSMTVEDNLSLGAYLQFKKRIPYSATFSEVYDMFPRLYERRSQLAGTLSGGERQMLAIGRALMAKPRVLLLDEPSLGLSPKITKDVLIEVGRLRSKNVSILLVEQNVRSALRISDYAYVLETGCVVLQGPAQEVAANSRVIDSYLGLSKAS